MQRKLYGKYTLLFSFYGLMKLGLQIERATIYLIIFLT